MEVYEHVLTSVSFQSRCKSVPKLGEFGTEQLSSELSLSHVMSSGVNYGYLENG